MTLGFVRQGEALITMLARLHRGKPQMLFLAYREFQRSNFSLSGRGGVFSLSEKRAGAQEAQVRTLFGGIACSGKHSAGFH
jgi:hypothetical protein